MNKSSEDSNIGKNDVSNELDAELSEETLEQIHGGNGSATPIDALRVINHLNNSSSENVRFTRKKFR